MSTVLFYLLPCVGCSTSPANDAGRADEIVHSLVELFTSRETDDAGQRGLKIEYARHRPDVSEFHDAVWLFDLMAEERELLLISQPAIRPIMAVVLDEGVQPNLRARLALLLGKMGHRSASQELLACLSKEKRPLVRSSLINALAMLGAAVPANVLNREDPDERPLGDWFRGLQGDAGAGAECVRHVRRIILDEQLEDVRNPDVPQLLLDAGGHHLFLVAKRTRDTENLYIAVWRVSQLHDPSAVETLILALRYHDTRVQHTALRCLLRVVAADAGPRGRPVFDAMSDYELHTMVEHERWKTWWDENADALRWHESTGRYSVGQSAEGAGSRKASEYDEAAAMQPHERIMVRIGDGRKREAVALVEELLSRYNGTEHVGRNHAALSALRDALKAKSD